MSEYTLTPEERASVAICEAIKTIWNGPAGALRIGLKGPEIQDAILNVLYDLTSKVDTPDSIGWAITSTFEMLHGALTHLDEEQTRGDGPESRYASQRELVNTRLRKFNFVVGVISGRGDHFNRHCLLPLIEA